MQYRGKKWLGLLLALLMLVSLLPVAAMADEGEQLDQTPSEELGEIIENDEEVVEVHALGATDGTSDTDNDDTDTDDDDVDEQSETTVGATDGEGTTTSDYVASVTTVSDATTTTTQYETLQAAFTAAGEATGAVTVTLLKDIELSDTVTIGAISNLMFDGGNFTISMNNAGKDKRVLSFNSTKSPVIKNLKVSATARYAIVLDQCGSSELNNVTVSGDYYEWNGTKIAVYFSNRGGGKIVSCNLCEVFKNAAAVMDGEYNEQLTITDSTIGELYVNSPTPATTTYSDSRAVIASGSNTIGTVICADDTTFRVSSDIVSAATTVKVTVTGADDNKVQSTPVAQVKGVQYPTLAAAYEAVEEDDEIKLLRDATGAGLVVKKSVTFDFGGHTYTVVDPTVGSAGTETNGFQLLRESGAVIMKNGTLKVGTNSCKILIQNYANLTLTDMTVDGTGSSAMLYVLSNNCGNTVLNGSTGITAPSGAVAFDVYVFSDYTPPTVTVYTTGTITGKIEVGATSARSDEGGKLIIKQGTFEGSFDKTAEKATIAISGGTFSKAVDEKWCAEGFRPVQNTDGTYGVTDQPESTPAPEPTATQAATAAPTAAPAPVKQSPKTGDEANAALWLVLATASVFGVALVAHRKKEN